MISSTWDRNNQFMNGAYNFYWYENCEISETFHIVKKILKEWDLAQEWVTPTLPLAFVYHNKAEI